MLVFLNFVAVVVDTPSPPSSRRKSPSRSPVRHGGGRDRYRGRGSPSPRRNRYRDYSPDRRRRRTPDRRRSRSPPPRRRDHRYRGGGGGRRRSISRSRSRSMSPMRRGGMGGGGGGGGGNRWSPKRKPNSPMGNNVPPQVQQPPPQVTAGPPPQYGVMPPQMYGAEPYGPGTAYNQYGVPPPPQQAFAPQPPNAYVAPQYNTAFPPPNAWGVNDAYAQQGWMQPPPVGDPNQQMAQMQAVPPTVAPPPVLVPTQLPPSMVAPQPTSNLNALPDAAPGTVDPNPTHDAVAQEAENQRDELKKQRTSYLKKTSVLKKELRMLKEQRKDFNTGSVPPSPTTKGFIDENEKLQNQILKKISTIENVIDMLTGIIGEENLEKDADMELSDADVPDSGIGKKQGKYNESASDNAALSDGNGARNVKKKKLSHSSADSTSESSSTSSSSSQSSSSSENEDDDENESKTPHGDNDNDDDDDDDTSSERLKHKAMESMKSKQINKKLETKDEKRVDERKRFNYVFYDPEMHWCQTCDIFPKTAKDYLNHLHTKDHINRESMETPWHNDMVNDQYPSFENALTKRTPIRGLTFFVPATAWFCKLCNIWMGDLHCASTHLKSQTHSNKYNGFLEKNPHFEVNWLADRQRVLNEKKTAPLPPQITSVSTTAAERSNKKSKRDEEKTTTSKKRKKRSGDKKDKKKKKKKQRAKKRKKNTSGTSSSSSSSSESSTSDGEDEDAEAKSAGKKVKSPIVVPELNNPDPASSIRVAMRKRENEMEPELMSTPTPAPPPPPPIITEAAVAATVAAAATVTASSSAADSTRIGKWTTTQLGGMPVLPIAKVVADDDSKRDDAIIQQWNAVQPVISESEKKLLEQLKGKLKNKPREEIPVVVAPAIQPPTATSTSSASATANTTANKHSSTTSSSSRRGGGGGGGGGDNNNDRRRRSRSPAYGEGRGGRGGARRSRSRQRSRSRGRSRTRSRSRGGWVGGGRRGGRRSRSRSRGRRSRSFDRRRRVSRSRSRSGRRRSRSYERRGRGRISRSRTRSASRSASKNRIEKPVIKHSEFRPRVPEREREKDNKKPGDGSKDKRDTGSGSKKSKSNSTSGNSNATATGGKKLPFIGKMPVFKKQVTTGGIAGAAGAPENGEKRNDVSGDNQMELSVTGVIAAGVPPPPPPPVVGVMAGVQQQQPQRVAAPTAAQIQMAMMEDAYGNAPPFHPDAGMSMNMMMVDYDDLMPDPVQFVNLMGQVPPPPPPPGAGKGSIDTSNDDVEDDGNMLPPGIDETESEEFVPKPMTDATKATLPKDLEEALNIIFPGERTAEEEEEIAAEEERKLKAATAGETQIIMDEPVMQVEDLAKEGIHMVTIEDTSIMAMDEASQLSMNEPLVFSKPSSHANISAAITTTTAMDTTTHIITSSTLYGDDGVSQNAADMEFNHSTLVPAPTPTPVPVPVPMPVPMPVTGTTTTTTTIAVNAGNTDMNNHVNGHAIDDITLPTSPMDIPMPDATKNETVIADTSALVYDLDDIPQPPDSPTDSEKQRRQEELDDLAMLGIDADDMAAQCM